MKSKKNKNYKNILLYTFNRNLCCHAFPVLLDGSKFFYDKQRDYDHADSVAAVTL